MSRTVTLLLFVSLLAGLQATSLAKRVAAQVSPAISPAHLFVEQPLGQGEKLTLPPITISNAGDQPWVAVMSVSYVGDQEERLADPAWFDFSPSKFELAPGQRQLLTVRMSIPRDATPGDYRALLLVRPETTGADGGGVSLNVASAATVLFTVKNVNFHFYDPVVDFYTGRSPFSWIGTGLLLAVAAVYILQRRYGLTIDFGIQLSRKD